jgi:hypothetical protein
MAKRYGLLLLFAVLTVVIVYFAISDTGGSLVFAHHHDSNTIEKAIGNDFRVKIQFKNTGKSEGTWNVNIAFEDSSWAKVGIPQNLTLTPGQTETLVWEGIVPEEATIGSVARLVVYYNDSFKALNWWIHVVPGAELTIKSSIVE